MEIPQFDEAKFREIMERDEKDVAINAFVLKKRMREAAKEPVSTTTTQRGNEDAC
jgi:hypothetical protein